MPHDEQILRRERLGVLATSNFGGTAAVTAVLAYGIFEIVGTLLLALEWGRAERPKK